MFSLKYALINFVKNRKQVDSLVSLPTFTIGTQTNLYLFLHYAEIVLSDDALMKVLKESVSFFP